jgi:hypothetical protein
MAWPKMGGQRNKFLQISKGGLVDDRAEKRKVRPRILEEGS